MGTQAVIPKHKKHKKGLLSNKKVSNPIQKVKDSKLATKKLWNIETNVRDPQIQLLGYLKTAKEIEFEKWTNETKKRFQILLIKNGFYLNTGSTQARSKLSEEQQEWLYNPSINMTYEQAESIFDSKEYSTDDMRGSASMSPLIKLGFVMPTEYKYSRGKIIITDVGSKILNGDITIEEGLLEQLLKYQTPSAIDKMNFYCDIKPFVGTLRLIKTVNELCEQRGLKVKGLTREELGIFALSMDSYRKIDEIANKVMDYREYQSQLRTKKERHEFRDAYIDEYLSNIHNPQYLTKQYANVIVRYLRSVGFVYLRGKYEHVCIDLEPRRMVEINAILENDDGRCYRKSEREWVKYYTTYGSYKLPYDTVEKQQEILEKDLVEIHGLEDKLHKAKTQVSIIPDLLYLKGKVKELREYRKQLKNEEINYDYNHDLSKVKQLKNNLRNLCKPSCKEDDGGLEPAVALEKWTNVGLNFIGDAISVNPNYPAGDDNEPIFTAAGDRPDIECMYEEFNVVCEVTRLTNRDQWHNEGQPVMRHVRKFEDEHKDKDCYCVFIAPSLHIDAINTFYISVKYEYIGKKQKIVPITFAQFLEIIEVVETLKLADKPFKSEYLRNFFDRVIKAVYWRDSKKWAEKIPNILTSWKKDL